jgi:hypothetical protein
MHFDTGNVKTNFFARYYDDNKSDVEKRGRLEHTEVGGFGGTAEVTQYVLPTVDIAIGGIGRTFAQVAVVLDPQSPQSDEYGSLGADFVKAYGEVTVNFEKMFVTVR